jgi:hypothetical protein
MLPCSLFLHGRLSTPFDESTGSPMPSACIRWIIRHTEVTVMAGALLMCQGCSPPPDTAKTLDALQDSASRGADLAKDAVETAKDPEKRKLAVDQLQRDLENPPRQFK